MNFPRETVLPTHPFFVDLEEYCSDVGASTGPYRAVLRQEEHCSRSEEEWAVRVKDVSARIKPGLSLSDAETLLATEGLERCGRERADFCVPRFRGLRIEIPIEVQPWLRFHDRALYYYDDDAYWVVEDPKVKMGVSSPKGYGELPFGDQNWLCVGLQANMIGDRFGGLLLTRISEESKFRTAGLQPGDVVESIDGEPLRDFPHAIMTLISHTQKKEYRLRIKRNGVRVKEPLVFRGTLGTEFRSVKPLKDH